jgi:hypothetical protein
MSFLAHRAVVATAVMAAVLVALSGCASETVGMQMAKSRHGGAPQGRTAPVADCRFSLESVTDRRGHSGLGTLAWTHVQEGDFMRWFGDGVRAVPGFTEGPTPVKVRLEIVKAYIQSLGTLKSTNLVVAVHITGEGLAPSTKVLRALDESMNWNSTEAEIHAALDRAMDQLQSQLLDEVNGACKRR